MILPNSLLEMELTDQGITNPINCEAFKNYRRSINE
jgi:hypothetical protein